MSDTAAVAAPRSRTQLTILAIAGVIASILMVRAMAFGASQAMLLVIGLALGATLYHAAFSFAAAYRRAFVDGEISGVVAQLVMLAVAIVLFAPTLAADGAPTGALAPVSTSMMVGAFLFGIGMQLANGCASGTLYTAGSGNMRMVAVLAFFCLGGFLASLHFHVWAELADFGAVSIGHTLGWGTATVLQLAILIAIYVGLRAAGGRIRRPMWWDERFSWRRAVHGPWPLLLAAGLLAVLNWVTLLVAGHPWSITWAFALWTAKAVVAMGWDPTTSPFWSGAFQQSALHQPILADTVSVMNVGLLLGSLIAASLAGKVAPNLRVPLGSLAAAVIGGLLMGYGARLAYGCNIGAFFSGVASSSLHGWVWIVSALLGTWVGIRLRPLFRLPP